MRTNNFMTTVFFCIGLLALTGCTNTGKMTETADTTITDTSMDDTSAMSDTMSGAGAFAEITGTKTDTTGNGTAVFSQKNGSEVVMKLAITFPTMANKSVAVHIHEHGDCGDSGKEAHGHWNPTNEQHGKWGSSAYHSGDIGNVQLNGEGTGTITLSSDRWTIGGDATTDILNKAIIVHSGVDDYKTQPTGNAGSRIGCGVIMRK
ncbi:MAG TPA: superoxide dismutase family protein [Sphingobacteriaceae bacterium]